MKIVHTGSTPPASTQSTQPSINADAKARAVAMLTGQSSAQVSEAPINQNAISAEEMSAVKASSAEEPSVIEETQPEVKAEEPKQDPEITKRFAKLAQQEKAMRAKEAAIRAREEAIKQREIEMQKPQEPQFDQSKYVSKDQLKQNALQALTDAGVSWEELTNQVLNPTQIDPRTQSELQALKSEIENLRKANEESRKAAEQQQSQAYQTAVKQIEMDVKKLVTNDPTFETIKTANAHKDVVELITTTFEKDGILLSVEEAAQQVEDYLADYLTEQYQKLGSVNKIKQRLEKSNASKSQATEVQNPSVKQQQAAEPAKKPQMKTLTNNTGASRPLSARERAILAFKGELK